MTTLMVTPYAPYRDGIASYAVQEVRSLRAAGHDVEVCSPLPSAAHHHLVISTNIGMVRLIARARNYQRIVIQAYPELLFGGCRRRPQRLLQWRLIETLAKRSDVELRLHELDYGAATVDRSMRAQVTRALGAATVTVHTAAERRQLVANFGLDPAGIELVDHGAHFAPVAVESQSAARAELGLPAEGFIFVCIGFLQRHKGFDRAILAFGRRRLEASGARIIIAGSVRLDGHPDFSGYALELEQMCATTDGAELRVGYLSDAEFDRYVIAADCVVLPYREIWSSGVVERAKLFEKPVIASAIGGLPDQLPEGSSAITTDAELEKAMSKFLNLADDRTPRRHGRDELQAMISPAEPNDMGSRLGRVARSGPARIDSARRGVPRVKRLIQRVTGWQLLPLYDQVNEIRTILVDAATESDQTTR